MYGTAGGAQLVPDLVTWASPDAVTWVATREDEFIGMVEFYDGHFVANDTANCTYRSFGSLNDAKRAIEDPARTLRTELPAYGGPRSRWDTIFATARQRRTATFRRTAA